MKLSKKVILCVALAISSPGLSAEEKPCNQSKLDNDIFWEGLHHNSFENDYRVPFGAVPTGTKHVTIRLRTCAYDVSAVRIRIWDDLNKREIWRDLISDELRDDPKLGRVAFWRAQISIPSYPTILYYLFEIRDGYDVDYYVDDEPKFFGGGPGTPSETFDVLKGYQLTVYDKKFQIADWAQGAFVYQIFPDRFRNGNPSIDPVDGGDWIYGMRVRKLAWNEDMCDPRTRACPDEFPNQYYGGDLYGISEKLEYLQDLGVDAIYLNPVTKAPSNHRYDIQNYYDIDPYLGDNDAFKELAIRAEQKGIRLIVDGVFNHTSADHPFFDLYSRWDDNLNLTSRINPGVDDGSGACESSNSPYRTWYHFPDMGRPALGDDGRTLVLCPRTPITHAGEYRSTYEAWFGYYTLPKLKIWNPAVRAYFFERDNDSVAPYWINEGARGWRLDVAGDVDPGATIDPNNQFWEGFRASIKRVNPESIMVAEEWGDASPMLLGNEMDTAMNYRFRSALMNWLFDGCQGQGCYGREFQDNDSTPFSSSGAIRPYNEDQFWLSLTSIQEDYPPASWHAAWNLMGSHDTNRIRFLLRKISRDDPALAYEKLKFLAAFQFAYPGAPTVYYGDEAGLVCDGKWRGHKWEDDPYNRCTFPWDDQGLKMDHLLVEHYKTLGQLRRQHPALRYGDLRLLHKDARYRTLAFLREHQGEKILAVFNRSHEEQFIKVRLRSQGHQHQGAKDLVDGQTINLEQGDLVLRSVPALSWKYFLLH